MIFSAVGVEVAWILSCASRNAASHRGPLSEKPVKSVLLHMPQNFPTDSEEQNGEYVWLNAAALSVTIDRYEQEFKGMTAN